MVFYFDLRFLVELNIDVNARLLFQETCSFKDAKLSKHPRFRFFCHNKTFLQTLPNKGHDN